MKRHLTTSIFCLALVILFCGCQRAPDINVVGGTVLVYPVEPVDGDDGDAVDVDKLLPVLTERLQELSPHIHIESIENQQLRVSIPGDAALARSAKRLLTATGHLELRIVANKHDHQKLIQRAMAQNSSEDEETRSLNQVFADDKTVLGRWVNIEGSQSDNAKSRQAYQVWISDRFILRDRDDNQLINVPTEYLDEQEDDLARYMEQQGVKNLQVLVFSNDGYDFTGEHLSTVDVGLDQYTLHHSVYFTVKPEAVPLLRGLTTDNLPEPDVTRQLGIILDDKLLSAPNIQSTIRDRGQITGKFSKSEVEFIVNVLRAGSLPARIGELQSENVIAPRE